MKILKTDVFDSWLRKLKDRKARAIILVHISRIEEGNLGKTRSVGEGLHEKKINHGPGYRLYFVKYMQETIILLCGGDKSTQSKDILKAQQLAQQIQNI